MYAYIILGLILAVFATDLVSADPPADPLSAVAGAAAVSVLVLVAGLGISGYILLRQQRIEADEQRFLRTVGALGRLYRLLIVAAYAVVLFGCGWSRLAAAWAGIGGWSVPVLAVNLAPLVVLLLVGWTALYWADRRLRGLMFERAGTPIAGRHWTFPQYVTFMLRQYLLVILVPMLVLLGVNDLATHLLPHPAAAGVELGVLLVAVALAGLWVRVCWRTEPLPEGRLRQRLLDLASRAGIRVANVLVWRTNLSIANGCMIGLVGPLRYILITDALLLSLSAEQVEAVFAHEAAHVTYRHPLLFLVMTLGAMAVAVLAGETVALATTSFWMGMAGMGTVVLAYLVVGFGYVSRRCEEECDLYAVRATVCPEGCSPPDAGPRASRPGPTAPARDGGAIPPPQADLALPPAEREASSIVSDEPPLEAVPPTGAVCEHRVRTFVTALRRIARLNGAAETRRGLRHFSIAHRCRFLEHVQGDPSRVWRAEQRIRRLKIAALLLAVLAFVVAGLTFAAVGVILDGGRLEPDQPEHPAGPEDSVPWENTWITRLIDRDEVNAVALRTPEFDRDADAVADLDDGRVPGPGQLAAPRDDDVAVADSRGHAVAVHPKGERAGLNRPEAGDAQELHDAVRRGCG